MRKRRISETDGYLLGDGDGEGGSTGSEAGKCNWTVMTGIFIIQVGYVNLNLSTTQAYGTAFVRLHGC